MTKPDVPYEFTPDAYRKHLTRYYTVIEYCDYLDEWKEEMIAIATNEATTDGNDENIYINTIHMDAKNWEDFVCMSEVQLRKSDIPKFVEILKKLSNI